MKKYISLFALPLFLVVFSSVISTKVKYAEADVPAPQNCPEGSQKLTYADGSVADAYVGQTVIDPNVPAAGIDQNMFEGVQKWKRVNGYKKNCAACNIPLLPVTKAYAINIYTAAGLSEIVKMEGGGGPYCYNAATGSVYEALSNQNCASRYPGTMFSGFRVVLVQQNYMCGVPSPWTDG